MKEEEIFPEAFKATYVGGFMNTLADKHCFSYPQWPDCMGKKQPLSVADEHKK